MSTVAASNTDSAYVECPDCSEQIKRGKQSKTGALATHRGSKNCLDTQKKKKKASELAAAKNRGISFFKKFLGAPKASQPAQKPSGSSSRIGAALSDDDEVQIVEPGITAPSDSTTVRSAVKNSAADLGLPAVALAIDDPALRALLQDLRAVTSRLPDSIPLGAPEDILAQLAIDPSILQDEEGSWRAINRTLDGVLQKDSRSLPTAELTSLVRRGPLGMDAVCCFLEQAAVLLGPECAVLQPRVERFIAGVASLVPSNSIVSEATTAALTTPQETGTTRSATGSGLPVEVPPAAAAPHLQPQSAQPASARGPKCEGVVLTVPDGTSPYTAYPFGMHVAHTLPWNVHLVRDTLVVQSTSCRGIISGNDRACSACAGLLSHPSMAGILVRMERGVHENAGLHYQPVGGLINIARRKAKDIKALRLTTLGQSRKLLQRARTLDEHKKFVMAVGSGKAPRLHALVRTALRCKAGIRRIVALVDAAGKRVYSPKGYEEEEMLRGILFLRMGGNRVAELAHRTCGLPSVSTLRQSSITQPLRPSPKSPKADEVAHNIEVAFPKKIEPASPPAVTLAVLMFDELKVTEAARWCPSTNKILGFCREHTHDSVLDFETMKEAEQLAEDLNEKNIHFASEATVAAIGKLCGNAREYSARPILISGTCKKESGTEHASLIKTVLDECRKKQAQTGCRIISVASDGEARRGLALEQLFLKRTISPSSPIYDMLRGMKLFNLNVGDDDITIDKDYKHVLKRLRNLALRRTGFVIHGVHITPGQIRRHLASTGATSAHLDLILNPKDKQYVAVMFTLLRDIWSLPEPLSTDRPGFAATRTALRTFGRLCYYLVMPYLQIDLSLADQLEYLSAAAHLAVDAFTYNNSGKQCMSPQLFLDIMHMVKNAYISVAKTKVSDPDGKFWLILLGTDRLETAFGILRTIVGNDTNADVLQLGTRLSHVVECANILARFPHWDREPRRLHASPVTATGAISRAADHVNPASWSGDVSVRTVVLQTCWQRGRKRVEEEFAKTGIKSRLQRIEETRGADMLSPTGKAIENDPDSDDEPEEEDDLEVRPSQSLEMDLEDVVGAHDCEHESKFLPTVEVGEKKAKVYKARALKEVIRFRANPSKDRLQRIANLPTYAPAHETSAHVDDSTLLGATSLCVDDPILTTVVCEKRVFGCAGQVITIDSDARSIQMISSELLPEPSVSVTFRVLQLRELTDNDETSWQWNGRYDDAYTIPGRLIEPVDPTVTVTEPGRTTFSFKTDDLRTLTTTMFDKLSKADIAYLPKVKRTDTFPYRSGEYACFACEKEGRDTTDALGERFCPRCSPPVELDWNDAPRVIEHMAGHLLFDRALDRSLELCGFCLRPAPQCLFYLKKGKGADSGMQVDFRSTKSRGCERARPFKYGFASKSTAHSPCSNVPIICPRCPPGQPAVWRYNFIAHCQRVHPSATPTDYRELYELSASETTGMRKLWDGRGAAHRLSRKTAVAELKISDAHRAVVPTVSSGNTNNLAMLSDDELNDDDLDDASITTDSDSSDNEPDVGEDDDRIETGTSQPTVPASTGVGSPGIAETSIPATLRPRVSHETSPVPEDHTVSEPEAPLGRGCRIKNKRTLARDTCICDKQVSDEEVAARENVIECAIKSCETRWYHMECHNFTFRPKGWKCDSCQSTKRRKTKK